MVNQSGNDEAALWEELNVGNEEQAFDLIQRALENEFGNKNYKLCFQEWPKVVIKLEGDGYDSTITADIAAGLVELQQAMNRSYSRLVHQSSNARGLSNNERDSLKFKAKVEKGSSLVEINLGEWASNISNALITKMSPEHIILTVVGVAAVAGSVVAYKAYLRHRSEDKKVQAETEARVAISAEETKRMEILAKAMAREPVIKHAGEDFDTARTEIVKGVGDAERITVSGVTLDNLTAQSIARSKRSESKDIQLNGNYEITRVDWTQEDEIRLRLINIDSKKEFSASFRDQSLEKDQIALLQNAEWSRGVVFLSINATELRGEITTATIVSVTPQPLKAS